LFGSFQLDDRSRKRLLLKPRSTYRTKLTSTTQLTCQEKELVKRSLSAAWIIHLFVERTKFIHHSSGFFIYVAIAVPFLKCLTNKSCHKEDSFEGRKTMTRRMQIPGSRLMNVRTDFRWCDSQREGAEHVEGDWRHRWLFSFFFTIRLLFFKQ